jgi:hypothetical protein
MAPTIRRFTRIKDSGENNIIILVFSILSDFSIKSYDFAPKYLRYAQRAKVQTLLIL